METDTRSTSNQRHGGSGGDRHVETAVVGAGQAGLSVGHHLARHDADFVLLDAGERIGDTWRNRWDSLRLFTPSRRNSLDGLAFPGDPHRFPTKDEMADYLQDYAATFDLPVRSATRVDRLTRDDGRFLLETSDGRWLADQVVVAMGNYQHPRVPDFASALDQSIVQLHVQHYRNPSQLRDGPVLVVGAANSGVEVAMELVDHHQVILAGEHPGHIPFDVEARRNQFLVDIVLRGVFHRVLSVDTPIGRRARPKLLHQPADLVRTKPRQLLAAGVERVGRVEGVQDGRPFLADGRRLDIANVVWCTGFRSGLSTWIDLPVFDEIGDPRHVNGISRDEPGLYFLGLHFLRALSSGQIHGVGRDAARVVDHLLARRRSGAGVPA